MDARVQEQVFDGRAFREALGNFATGVTVITTVTADGERLGTTASSFNSVSLDPPLVLFSIARNAKAFPAWQKAGAFAVNILAEDQDELSTRFARPLTDKWSGLSPEIGPAEGLPLLPGALVSMECTSFANYDGGDHVIMVGKVVSLIRRREGARPLVFFGSKYRALDDEDPIPTPRNADIWLHGW
ncbi:MAG: flavin reductase family protein [Rhizobiaceae bacterium]|nr:flavin reductase family protein [Rhizobiaceae bacterium]